MNKRPRITTRAIIASSTELRANWVVLAKGLKPKISAVFNYNEKGVNLPFR